MKRKIKSVYQYTDYRVLMLDDFTNRSTANSKYSLRAYARDLNLSAGYLSSILRGKKHFKQVNCRPIFLKLGLSSQEELLYLENLVTYQTSTEPLIQQQALSFMKSQYETLGLVTRSDRNGILKSSQHFISYMISEKEHELSKIKQWALQFEIDEATVEQALEDLISTQVLRRTGDHVEPEVKNIAITDSHEIFEFAVDFQRFLADLIRKKGGISFPLRSTHSLVMGFDSDSFEQAIEVYKQFLHQIYRISKNSASIDRITVFSDLMLTNQITPSVPKNT